MNEAENNYLNPSYYQTPQGFQAIDIIQAFWYLEHKIKELKGE